MADNRKRPANHSYYRAKSESGYRRSKVIFWLFLLILLLIALLLIIFSNPTKTTTPYHYVTAGICGCVKEQAVYRLPQGADIATLIQYAGGITYNGDIRKVNLDHELQNDKVYHIPCLKNNLKKQSDKFLSQNTQIETEIKDEELVSFLYIGFPAVYFLIQYSKTYKILNVIYIPHSTVFLDNEYRIIDLYFTLGIDPTLDIL